VNKTVLLLVGTLVLVTGRAAAEEAGPTQPTELDQVLAAMQKTADSVQDLSAEFTYYLFLADFYESEEEADRKSGDLHFKKPEFVRINFRTPYEKQVYITPDLYEEYRPDTNVVTRVRRDRAREREGSETLAIAMGTAPSKLRERFALSLVDDPALSPEERRGLRVLQLIPKDRTLPGQVVKVWLWVDVGDWLPRRVRSFRRNGDTETFLFSHVKTNQGLSDRLFQLTITDNMVVDDLTASPPPGNL
jgi:outer membrane lipoprotein-sorting protein